jgi:probable H4MPT-linked C1 transfer pathway protein
MDVLGLDIGGANLKAAHTNGRALSVPFALWKNPSGLSEALARLRADMPSADAFAVTMTGELCDCFDSKRQGVGTILDAVVSVAGSTPLHVWNRDGHFVNVTRARRSVLEVASANWLALATFAGRYAAKGPALLIDIGSTTTDIVPLLDGSPVSKARTDRERLRNYELRYTGVRRTPLCALLAGYGAAEVFATTQDMYMILDFLPEDPANTDTADGRPATKAAAEMRIARMLCSDLETCTIGNRHRLVELARSNQTMILGDSFFQVTQRMAALPQSILLAGEGEFLSVMALREQEYIPPCRLISLSKELGPEVSKAACAYAVARLAAEQE